MKKDQRRAILKIISILIIVQCGVSYKELQLQRFPDWQGEQSRAKAPLHCNSNSSPSFSHLFPEAHDSSINTNMNRFNELCYHKDIAYTTAIFMGNHSYSVSLDFTMPVSWLKSSQCLDTSCAQSLSKVIEVKLRFRGVTNMVSVLDAPTGKDNAWVGGSNEEVIGIMEDTKIEFWVKDNAKLKEFSKLVLMGAFIQDQKDHVILSETPFLLATHLPSHLSQMTDGAISLQPQSPLLHSLFSALSHPSPKDKQSNEIMTIYMDEFGRHAISFGELSLKYAKDGLKGINWIPLQKNGSVQIQNAVLMVGSKGKTIKSSKPMNGVFTLSSSYLAFPPVIIDGILSFLKGNKHQCHISPLNSYIECPYSHRSSFYNLSISIHFSHKQSLRLYFSQLIYSLDTEKSVLKIRTGWDDSTCILGEPIFKAYLMIFNYGQMSVGYSSKFSNKSDIYASMLISIVRLFLGVLLLLCFLYFCYRPCDKLMIKWRKYKMPPAKKFRKTMKAYNPLDVEEELPYYTGNQSNAQ